MAIFQSQVNNSKHPVTVSWEDLNKALENDRNVVPLNFEIFNKIQNTPLINNYIKNGGYSETGIVFNPVGYSPEMNQPQIDPEHNTVKRTAMHAVPKNKK